jgi:2-polyprenyl-3-methyl-5-hydroxy-6-metoxy-1,4-benzoquinol methylase
MPSSPLKNFARRIARPFTGPLDGRVADINRRVGDTRSAVEEQGERVEEQGAAMSRRVEELTCELGTYTTTVTESNSYVGVEMRRFEESIQALRTHIDEHEAVMFRRVDALDHRRYVERLDFATEARLEQLDGAVANLVNRASGHRGFAAQAGLWFNPPVTVELGEGHAQLAVVNERIVEVPFAMGALARLKPPARILDIGSAESTFALSAASLGYHVTAVDLHPLPYVHPNIESIARRFEDWDPGSKRFGAVFLISTIEHFGLGAYGEPVEDDGADIAALARIRDLLDEKGFLVLTTPYGPARVDALERTYDDDTLNALFKGWIVLDRHIVLRRDERTWTAQDLGGNGGQGVVMVVAVPDRSA